MRLVNDGDLMLCEAVVSDGDLMLCEAVVNDGDLMLCEAVVNDGDLMLCEAVVSDASPTQILLGLRSIRIPPPTFPSLPTTYLLPS